MGDGKGKIVFCRCALYWAHGNVGARGLQGVDCWGLEGSWALPISTCLWTTDLGVGPRGLRILAMLEAKSLNMQSIKILRTNCILVEISHEM